VQCSMFARPSAFCSASKFAALSSALLTPSPQLWALALADLRCSAQPKPPVRRPQIMAKVVGARGGSSGRLAWEEWAKRGKRDWDFKPQSVCGAQSAGERRMSNLEWIALDCNAVQWSAVQCSPMQCSPMQCSPHS